MNRQDATAPREEKDSPRRRRGRGAGQIDRNFNSPGSTLSSCLLRAKQTAPVGGNRAALILPALPPCSTGPSDRTEVLAPPMKESRSAGVFSTDAPLPRLPRQRKQPARTGTVATATQQK